MKDDIAQRGRALLIAAATGLTVLVPKLGLAESLTLAAASQAALEQVRAATGRPLATGKTLSQPELFDKQSFRLLRGAEVGNLVSGRGLLPAPSPDGQPAEVCFVSLVRTGAPASLLLTIGSGDWETESCTSVVAIGLLPGNGAQARAGIIYKTSAPHASPIEPVVVAWSDTQPLQIDAAASKRASLAGAETLKEVREALR